MIEASDTIKPEHTDESLNKSLALTQDPFLRAWPNTTAGYKTLIKFLLEIPANYRDGAVKRTGELMKATGANLATAAMAVGSELACQLGAPIFDDLSAEEIQKQREDLEHLVRYAVLAVDDAASIRTFTEADSIRHIARAAIGTLLANKMIQPVEHGDWIKVGYPRHLM